MVFLKLIQASIAKLSIFLIFITNIDFYSGIYDNHMVSGDFNMVPSHAQFLAVMKHYNYYNLIKKNNSFFKGDGSCIDLILTNRKYCFKNTSSFETGISDTSILFIRC